MSSSQKKPALRDRAKKGLNTIYRDLFDRQHGINKIDNVAGGDTKIRAMNSLKANGIVTHILSESRYCRSDECRNPLGLCRTSRLYDR